MSSTLASTQEFFRYINGTRTHGIKFQASDDDSLQGYLDTDSAGEIESRRSTSGYAFMMNNRCISMEEHEVTNGNTIINGSIVYGAIGGYTSISLVEGVPVRT